MWRRCEWATGHRKITRLCCWWTWTRWRWDEMWKKCVGMKTKKNLQTFHIFFPARRHTRVWGESAEIFCMFPFRLLWCSRRLQFSPEPGVLILTSSISHIWLKCRDIFYSTKFGSSTRINRARRWWVMATKKGVRERGEKSQAESLWKDFSRLWRGKWSHNFYWFTIALLVISHLVFWRWKTIKSGGKNLRIHRIQSKLHLPKSQINKISMICHDLALQIISKQS